MRTGHSDMCEGSARRRRRAGLAILLACVAGFAYAAPQDFNLNPPCAGALPRHIFKAKAGTAFDERIGLLNGDGKRIFWAFLSPPTAGSGGPRCSAIRPGAVFRCGELTIALPAGTPKSSVPDREFARISGTPASRGAINFRLIIQEDGANGAGCQRPYLLEIVRPPTAPADFMAVFRFGPPRNIVALSWRAATDDSGVVRYEIQRCDGEFCPNFRTLKSVTTTFAADREPLRFNTDYQYRVRAFDRAGNASEFSNISLVQTPAEGPHPH